MGNLKIVLLEQNCGNSDKYRDETGALFIPVPNDVEVEITKKKEDLTNIESVISDFSNTFDLPLDNISTQILGNLQTRNTNQGKLSYRAILLEDDIPQIDGFIYINEVDQRIYDGYLTVPVQLIGTHQTWKDYLKNNTLCDLDLGTFTWNESNILSAFSDDYYQDGNLSIYPLLANYGRRFKEVDNITIYDIRFVVYLLPIIRAMFCAAGYDVKSQFLNSNDFRRKAAYLLKPNFGNDESIIKGFDTQVTNSAEIQVPAPFVTPNAVIIYDTDIVDLTNSYDNVTGAFTTNRELTDLYFTWKGTIRADASTPPANFPFNVELIFSVFDGLPPAVATQNLDVIQFTAPNQTHEFCFDINVSAIISAQVANNPTGLFKDTYLLAVGGVAQGGGTAFIELGSTLTFYTCNTNHFNENDIIDIAKVLRCGFSLYDLFIDIKRLFNLRIKTNESEKTVYIEPEPATYETFETLTDPSVLAEGFNGNISNPNDIIDITDKIDNCKFAKKTFPQQQIKKVFDFRFVNSTDKYTRYSNFDDKDNALFSNVDANVIGVDKKEIKLTIFEPTLNDYDIDISTFSDQGAYIPYMWEFEQSQDTNDLPMQGSNIQPRIFNVLGFASQILDDGDTTHVIGWIFEGNSIQAVPNIGQVFEANVTGYGSPFGVPQHDVVFSDNLRATPNEKNIVNTYYQDSLRSSVIVATLSTKSYIDSLFIKCLDIAKIARIYSENGDFMDFNGMYDIISVKKNLNSDDLVSIVLRPKIPCQNG